jgi:hypothetical protein
MEPEFITYQKFDDPALADDLAETLNENGIAFNIQEETTGFDPSLVMSNAAVYYAVKIKSEDFEKVNALLKEKENIETDQVEKDYYLFGFTDSELRDVIIKADEWSVFDVVLARKILAERGINMSDTEISRIHEKRVEELKRPEKPQTTWIIIGYICAFAGGLLAVFIGWYLVTAKKTLPDGKRVYEYDEHDRQQGKYIFYIGITIAVLAFIARIIVGLNA